jgi:hypothetical protein
MKQYFVLTQADSLKESADVASSVLPGFSIAVKRSKLAHVIVHTEKTR